MNINDPKTTDRPTDQFTERVMNVTRKRKGRKGEEKVRKERKRMDVKRTESPSPYSAPHSPAPVSNNHSPRPSRRP